MGRYKDKLIVGLLLCALGGCARGLVPVIDLNQASYSGSRSSTAVGTIHTVVRGDSLHSIAWQYGLNYRQLAAANGIAAPYTIYPGQRLKLRYRASRPRQTVASAPTPVVGKALSGSWHWPAQGTVVARQGGFGRKKGIDISGRPGQAVFPAKGGKVVYAGNGIRGYGNLLIVKHDEEYLSAYAYNKRMLVAEGDQVKVGQKIAEIGTNGSAREAKLHFEIRRAGKAVDPLSLLPKRQNNVKI
ncbi:MAG: peptidoglycan DD-metalloendopeptidase family protein [Pseudomonadales bacterium]